VSFLLTVVFLTIAPAATATTTWYVSGVGGSDSNSCISVAPCKTIGHAISLAASGDTIKVAAATYRENLTIRTSLNIIGSSAKTTIIDGRGVNSVVTISGTSAHVALSKLTIRNGSARNGGGISNSGTLTLSNSTISGNLSINGGAGGGIANYGPLTIKNSTISGNSAVKGTCTLFCLVWGGGIANYGPLTMDKSTISGNRAANGGGIFFQSGSVLTVINNSTISGNSAATVGGGISNRIGNLAINNSTISGNSAGQGGGIENGNSISVSTLMISNSTVGGNSAVQSGGIYNFSGSTAAFQNSIDANASGNCFGVVTSKGHNLSGDQTCNFRNSGDLNNTDPQLGPLQNNGGPTQTMALPSGSPAVDAGNPNGCTDSVGHLLKTDQRGKPRPDPEDTGGCDIGAYERQSD
jgi:hypothetical protein